MIRPIALGIVIELLSRSVSAMARLEDLLYCTIVRCYGNGCSLFGIEKVGGARTGIIACSLSRCGWSPTISGPPGLSVVAVFGPPAP